ncbi:MAG: 3-dehydroquinate synthase family protein [Acidimicrobiales bacterium]
MISVPVPVAGHPYDVLIGPGARHELAAVLAATLGPACRKAAVVTQEGIGLGVDPGMEARTHFIPDGEDAKGLVTVGELCRSFSRWGLSRADVVVAVGGGVVTDTAGFAAAIYHRGVPVVHVATTLLAQVDAAIGGKTGVNLPEGKNLIGAFWQPRAVICDTEVLSSLPPEEYRSGLGEMAKYHFLGAGDLGEMTLPERVARCVAVKAAVVASDEREAMSSSPAAVPASAVPAPAEQGAVPQPRPGARATLNYGHTLAHALETAGGYGLRHGEAVSVGLVFAAELAHRLGRVSAARVREHREVVASYDLPSTLPAGADPDQIIELMGRDKKRVGAEGLTFVLDGPGGVEVVAGVDPATAASVLAEMAESADPGAVGVSAP